jgi:hypothetical protein
MYVGFYEKTVMYRRALSCKIPIVEQIKLAYVDKIGQILGEMRLFS